MGKSRDQLLEVSFRCIECSHEWVGPPSDVHDAPAEWWHPWTYSADCPKCGCLGYQSPAERGRLKAWAHATGPRTEEGKAASAANLAGHPTPEEARITRLNGLKHGAYAENVAFFPARPGKYSQCTGCHYYGKECVENPPSYHKNPHACLRRTELFMQHEIAFDSKDPQMLMNLWSRMHARLHALLEDMFLAVMEDGARFKTVEWYYDKDGGFHLAQWRDEDGNVHQLHKIEEHPLIKRITDVMSKIGMALGDLGMTPKVQEEAEMFHGFLEQEEENIESIGNYTKRLEEQNQQLRQLIHNSSGAGARVIQGERVESDDG